MLKINEVLTEMSQFTENHFQLYSKFIYTRFGMQISHHKKSLLFLKVDKAMKFSGLDSYDDYFQLISNESNKEQINTFANVITTNTTEFFREMAHFDYLKENIDAILSKNPRIMRNGELRIWSAGCSTGQEAYTIAMVMSELLGDSIDIKILASDISQRVLSVAQKGVYPDLSESQIPKYYFYKYFEKATEGFSAKDDLKKFITFRTFNLVDDFSFKKGFDIIFCRNVMIYFDVNSQERLIHKFYQTLSPGGLFLVGHSESLMNKTHAFKYIKPAIYTK